MLKNNHSHSCSCTSHNHSCNCHSHSHNEHHHCSCEHTNINIDSLTDTDVHFLKHLLAYEYLPLTQFILKSSKEKDFESIALSPVFIIDTNDTMEQVKNIGAKLNNLCHLGFITLDYDIPLKDYTYNEYHTADIYKFFKETVEKAKTEEKFLGDIAYLQCGSIAPTEKTIGLLGTANFNKHM